MSSPKITAAAIRAMKGRAKIAALTAYDFALARILDEAGIDFIHVGDTVGMVVLGYPDTTSVTMEDMEHHVRAVARARPRALIGADLPFKSYETVETAVANARRLADAGADAVKAEGGREIADKVRAIVESGIPYCGHIGMLPQHVREEGGYKIKGRTAQQRDALVADALALADAGAFAVVLEIVTPEVAKEVTELAPIPTIGIGSGPHCDGQVLVSNDLFGTFPWFTPRFIKPVLNTAEQMRNAARQWKQSLG